jgi:hypothetical protein
MCGAIERVDARLDRRVTPGSVDVVFNACESQCLACRREDRRVRWEQLGNSLAGDRDIVQNFHHEASGGQGSGTSLDPLGSGWCGEGLACRVRTRREC